MSAYRGWVICSLVYLDAFLNRSSLGVAGLMAQQRFGISPGELSTFILLQLGVYAAIQIPAGILADRYGPRRMLVIAAVVMGVGQLAFSFAPSFGLALLARALLGCGDGLTYVAVLRYISRKFPVRQYPLLATASGAFGMLGNVVATVPLAILLHHLGWAPVFAGAAVLALVTSVIAFVLIPGTTNGQTQQQRQARTFAALRTGATRTWQRVRVTWSLPGTRLGFWLHFATPGVNNAYALLWGSPYLVKACGFSTSQASVVLMGGVLFSALGGPILGWVIGRHAQMRTWIALGFCIFVAFGWLVIFALGAHPPVGYVVPFMIVMAIGGQISLFAFAVARDYNHVDSVGTASGIVNVGGFIAGIAIALGIGWVLDGLGGTTARGLHWAIVVTVAVQVFGVVQLARWIRRMRSFVLAEMARGIEMPVVVLRRRWDLKAD